MSDQSGGLGRRIVNAGRTHLAVQHTARAYETSGHGVTPTCRVVLELDPYVHECIPQRHRRERDAHVRPRQRWALSMAFIGRSGLSDGAVPTPGRVGHGGAAAGAGPGILKPAERIPWLSPRM